MKFFLKVFLSLVVGGLSLWLAFRKIDLKQTLGVLRELSFSAVLIYLLSMIPVHFFRAWRWKYLLRPIGVTVAFRRLILLSTVGFMAILALPFRLGEFVRPYYIVRGGQSRMSAVLGTVAVERIVDGLVIAILFFLTYLMATANGGQPYSSVLTISAWISLLGFLFLTLFLAFSLRWPQKTIRMVLSISLLPRLAPQFANKIEDKLSALIQGFRAIRQARDMIPFLVQTLFYWAANGFGMWLLARSMHLPIPLSAAYAAMAFTGVLISLPNAPGLVGQFHAGIILALAAYVPEPVLVSVGCAYAVALHGIQFAWYVGLGFLAMPFASEGHRSLRGIVLESNRAAETNGET